MNKWTAEYRREYVKKYKEENREKVKAWQKAWGKRVREQRKAETGSTYDKEHYERYKHLFAAARKKYHARKRQEGLASGLIKPPLTPEEREARRQAAYRRVKEKAQYKYKHNINGHRDKNIAYGRKRWQTDPIFRERSREYVKEHRARKRAEELPQKLAAKRIKEEAKALVIAEKSQARQLKRDLKLQEKLALKALREGGRKIKEEVTVPQAEKQPVQIEVVVLPGRTRKRIISHTQELREIKQAIKQNNWAEVRRLNVLIKSRIS
jgi:hypothetical protein